MRLLLDTHALLWFLAGEGQRFSDQTRHQIEDRATEVLASTVSLWEIAIKSRIAHETARIGFKTLPL